MKSSKASIVALLLAGAPAPVWADGFLPGNTGILSSATKTPMGTGLFDANGRPTGPMSPTALYSGVVTAATVSSPGAYAPADLPVALTFGAPANGETAAASVASYKAVSATVSSAGSGCSATDVFTVPATGTTISVSDGSGLSGSTVTINNAGSGVASVIPTNPVTPTTTNSACTPPKFTLAWGVNGLSMTNQGWGYTAAPTGTGSASTATGGSAASVTTTIATAAVNYAAKLVPTSKVGKAGGIASLDSSGNVTSPIASYQGNFNRSYSSGSTVVAVPIVQLPEQGADAFTGLESVLMGGITGSDGNTSGVQLNILGRGYGAYNAGCVLCVMDTADGLTGSGGRAAISGADYRAGAQSVVATQGYDQVAFYEYADNLPARIVAQVSGVTATTLTLSTALTAAQMSQLHAGMYLETNMIDTTISGTQATGSLPPVRYYASYLSSWTSTTLTVTGWAVLSAAGSTASGQVPSMTDLDTAYSSYKVPMVFVGEPTKTFGRNLYLAFNYDRAHGNSTSLIHKLEGEEMDMAVVNDTVANSVTLHGITITPLYSNSSPSALTKDSYDLQLAGDIPDHLLFNEAADNNVIRSNSLYVHGNEGVNSTSGVTSRIGFEYDSYTDSANDMRLVHYLTKESATTGWSATSMTVGLQVDGSQGSTTSGTFEGGVRWNDGGTNNGGLALCGGSGVCGYEQRYDGSTINLSPAYFDYPIYVKYGAQLNFESSSVQSAFYLQADDSGNLVVGTQVSGGGSLSGLNNLSAVSATLSGTAKAAQFILNPTDATGTPFFSASSRTAVSLVNDLGSGVIFDAFEHTGTILNATNYVDLSAGAYIQGRTAANAVAGTITPDVNGNWVFGTQVSGGGNVSGINNLSATSGTFSDNMQSAYILISSASLTAATASGVTGGQGSINLWNVVNHGAANTEYVNVDPGNAGGFAWYEETTGGALSAATEMMNINSSGLYSFVPLRAQEGLVTASVKTTAGTGPSDPDFTLSALPTTGLSDGEKAWCTDCTLNGVTGVEAYWHAAAAKWTDSQNATLVN